MSSIPIHAYENFKRRAGASGYTAGKMFLEEFKDDYPRVNDIANAADGTKLADLREEIESCHNCASLYWKLVRHNLVSMR